MWPNLIAKAKEGGLDVIQTYVFWNLHEPQQAQVTSFLLELINYLQRKCMVVIIDFFCSMSLVEDLI